MFRLEDPPDVPRKPEGKCWLWQGSKDGKGYGKKKHRGTLIQVHVFMWIRYMKKKVPEGMELDHLCRVRHCANPWHLEVVSHQENVRRAAEDRKSPGNQG